MKTITSEIVVAYSHCPRKAYLLLCTDQTGVRHEYGEILERHRQMNQDRYHALIGTQCRATVGYGPSDLKRGAACLVGSRLRSPGLDADCAALTKVPLRSALGGFSYEPTIVAGTHSLSAEDKTTVAFAGLVLGRLQKTVPTAGKVIGMDARTYTVNLRKEYKPLQLLLTPLQQWAAAPPSEPPPVILNKHCPLCPFRLACRDKAERDDDLSLLDRMTLKARQRYQGKGIFTVRQLSYLFRPRKSKKQPQRTPSVFKVELQALALRTGKIYLQETPVLAQQPTELFLDIEGKPDEQLYYLIGLQVRDGGRTTHHAFWADTPNDEATIWTRFLALAKSYADAPIYHYGNYEATALERMARRYQPDGMAVRTRLVNLTTHIYGKVYFPVRSNSLKDIGRFLGASWTAPSASGLHSLVWRHRWEEGGHPDDKQALLTYNAEDCDAVRVVLDALVRIGDGAHVRPDIDFADAPKQVATERGERLHGQFEALLHSAHASYDRTKIALGQARPNRGDSPSRSRRGYHDAIPTKVSHTRHVAALETCPKHPNERLRATNTMVEQIVIDLAFTRSGCRKTVTRWIGPQGYCRQCGKYYLPFPAHQSGHNRLFGHSFQAWVVYQRLVLRLPYRAIAQTLEEQFGQPLSEGSIVNFIGYFARYYAETEERIVRAVLSSPFVHADETKISIRGTTHYVWVFTNGTHVFYRMTDTREANIAHETLSGYSGVLVSDFFGGYDALPCRQQKCLVHLIRDLNDDLWDHPFDTEFEQFVSTFGHLITPILDDYQRYGPKVRHLRKHRKRVDTYYATLTAAETGRSALVATYIKRLERYRHSLFTFLEEDGLPWNNNTAERALRHLAVQRKISGSFFEGVAREYLLLLGITQTCRFQSKSLLRFLVSGERDIDAFKAPKRGRTGPATRRRTPMASTP